MYECPNCASNLKFNIERQKLFCEHCETTVDPYSFYKEKDAEEMTVSAAENGATIPEGVNEEEYEVTIFSCPQCGGEIMSDDITAATFCSFCGASTILDSRISKERCPGYIIPFTKTKEDCAQGYAKMMRRAFFAPDELKDKKNIEKFRAIYMPYWVYGFAKEGRVSFSGNIKYRSGEYSCTDYYDIHCELQEQYKGLAFDASASFSDDLSAAVSLFDFNKIKKFVPGFLSGFYADIGDVSKYIYQNDAEKLVVEDGFRRITGDSIFREYHLDEERNRISVENAIRPSECRAEFALFPVWFLSYRKGDRVCYAVVNGQTGKTVADLPVDSKKYIFGSVLLAVPLFILLNLFFTITPTKILLIAVALALVCIFILDGQLSDVFAKESGESDKGLMWPKNKPQENIRPQSGQEQDLAEAMAKDREKAEQRRGKKDTFVTRMSPKLKEAFMLIIYTLVSPIVVLVLWYISVTTETIWPMVTILIYMVFLVLWVTRKGLLEIIGEIKSKKRKKKRRPLFCDFNKKLKTLIKPMAGILCAILIFLWNPVADEYYYTGAFVCMGSVLWAIMDIIKQHNILTTRKLPQFNKRGGDENA